MALNDDHREDANGRAERDPRIERLYREAARQGPPAHLDAAILAAARREAGAGPRSLASKLRRWQVPISIAAVVVVSASLVILMQEEEGKRDEAAAVQAIPAPADQPAAPPAPDAPPAIAKEAMRRAPEATVSAGDLASPAGKQLPQPFLGAPATAEQEPLARSAAGRATAERAAGAQPVPSDVQSAPPDAEFRQVAPVAGALATKPLEQDRPPVWQGFEKEPPEKWLQRIEELRVQGREPEAQEMLAEFRRRFPEHPLPSSPR